MSRLNFASDNITKQSANMEAAYGRIMGVDIAAESTPLGQVQRPGPKLGRHAFPGQFVFGRRADASAIKLKAKNSKHHIQNNTGIRLPKLNSADGRTEALPLNNYIRR